MKILVLDVGGTAIKYAFMDGEGEFLRKGDVPTPHEGREEFLAAIASIAALASETEPVQEALAGVAVSLPGCYSACFFFT